MKKGWFVIGFVFMLFAAIIPCFVSASLGIMPAKKEVNFVPNGRQIFEYTAFSDNPDKMIHLFADGDLAQYVTLNKEFVTGSGKFKAIIDFPASIEKPGRHMLYIGAKEEPPENVFIGTVVIVKALIAVYAPYPGKYVEAELNLLNGNVNEDIPVELRVINRGKQDFNVSPEINFYDSEMKNVYTMQFRPLPLEAGNEQYFRKYLNTSSFLPGKYFAEAVINYEDGDILKINATFNMGSLFVNITNFTTILPTGGLKKFSIFVESKWNDNIKEVYADVNVWNSSYGTSFRTPSTDLKAWKTEVLFNYLDTSNMLGEYDTNITLSYVGQNSWASGILIIAPENKLTKILVMAGAIAGAIVIALAIYIAIKRQKGKKKR